jgi:hypothetical protein
MNSTKTMATEPGGLAMARAKGYTLKGREVIETSKGQQV